MSVAATAGAAAWVVPEILTAKPAAAAVSGGPGVSPTSGSPGGSGGSPATSPGGSPATSPATSTGSSPATSPATSGGSASTAGGATAPVTSPSTLAFSGIDIERDAEVGAALVAGGWVMHRWASRTPQPAPATVTEANRAESQVDPT